jgi:ketosteroid isomerase-like protein
MRLLSITLLLLLSFACTEKSNSNLTTADYKSIKNVLDSQVSAWNKGDIKTFMKGYWNSDSLRFIGKNGVRNSYKSVESNYLNHYKSIEKMGHLSFDSLIFTEISGEGKIANVTGQWKIKGTNNAGGFFSLFIKKVDNNWKIIVDHTW